MKTISTFIVIFLLIIVKTSYTQETWYKHYVFSSPVNINSVAYNNSHMGGVSCGDAGFVAGWKILGDDAWFPISNPTNKNLHSIRMIDSSGITKAFIVGETGVILKSNYVPDIGPFSFYKLTSPTTLDVFSVYFTDYNNGLAVGDSGIVIKTTNGGSNWYIISRVTQNKLFSVHFPNSSTAYAVGVNGTVIKTTNSGQNWSLKPQPINDTLRCVWFVSNDTGFVVSRFGAIYKTTNGGDNWQIKPSGITQSINTILFVNQTTGYAAGNSNKIVKTTNSGESWQLQALPTLYKVGNFLGIAKSVNGGISVVGSNSTAAGTFPGSIGIQEKKFSNYLFISPNPASSFISINLQNTLASAALTLQILNLHGQLILQQKLYEQTTEINISQLHAGIYMAKLQLSDGSFAQKKFIVIK